MTTTTPPLQVMSRTIYVICCCEGRCTRMYSLFIKGFQFFSQGYFLHKIYHYFKPRLGGWLLHNLIVTDLYIILFTLFTLFVLLLSCTFSFRLIIFLSFIFFFFIRHSFSYLAVLGIFPLFQIC